MFKVSAEQIDVLKQRQVDDFESRMCEHIHAQFPSRAKDPADLHSEIVVHLEHARDYGLRSEYDLRRYLEFAYDTGDPTHGELSWADDILSHAQLHPFEKMEQIESATLFERRKGV